MDAPPDIMDAPPDMGLLSALRPAPRPEVMQAAPVRPAPRPQVMQAAPVQPPAPQTAASLFGGRMSPERALAFSAIGQGLSQLGSGQTVDLSKSHQALMERKSQTSYRKSIEESGILDRMTPQQRSVLASMPPALAQSIIMQMAFPTPAKKTSLIEEFEYAVNHHGYQGTIVDFKNDQARAGATNVTVGGGVDNEKFSEQAATVIVKRADATATMGDAARRSLLQLDRLEAALSNSPGGVTAGVKSWLGTRGIDSENLDEIQLADALISQLVPGQRAPGAGTMSDADLDLYKKSLPRLMNQPGGNALIIETMRGIAEYDIAMGEIANSLLLQEITPREAFDAYRAVPNPLAGFSATTGGNPDATAPPLSDAARSFMDG